MSGNGRVYFFDTVARKFVEPDYNTTAPDGKPTLPMDCVKLDGMVGYCVTNQIKHLETENAELKRAVEELREAAKETLGAWHGGTMNDVRAAMTLMEETLKETEGLL
jgi:hypothetical protein